MTWSEELAAELAGRIRGEVRGDPMSRALYSTDASIYQATPLAVVIPRDADDVRATVEFAAVHRLPLLPRGAGTSLEGQTVNEALVVDLSRHLDRVLEVNAEEGWARVEPGVVQDALGRHVAPQGLTFGPDTATGNRATLGGMIGNNSAGAHSIVYGKTVDHVLEVRCLLADGTEAVFGEVDGAALQAKQRLPGAEGRIYRTVAAVVARHGDEIRARYPRLLRHVSGYSLDEFVEGAGHRRGPKPFNVAKLIVGSEGTLATVLEARVRLVPRPRATALGVVQFDDLVAAMEAARLIVGTGPSAVELIDRLIVEQARSHPGLSRLCGFVEGEPAAVLITEYFGEDDREVAGRVEGLRRLLERQRLGYGFHAALTAEAQAEVWQVRKAGLTLMLALRGDPKPIAFVEDTAVDVDRLPEYVARLQQVVAEHDTWAGFYGHASVGCLHFRPVINLKDAGDVRKLRSIAERVRDLVAEFDGSLSGEHGDGRTRTEFLAGFYGEALYRAFRVVKTAFDPEGRLNPGNICDPIPAGEVVGAVGVGRPVPLGRAAAAALPRPALEEAPESFLDPVEEPLPHAPFRIDGDLRYGPGYRARAVARYLDWSREGGLDRAVELCNGNGACRKLDAGTMCPSYMVTRDEEHTTRGRANALRAIIAGALPGEDFTSRRLYQVLDLCLGCKGCRGECPSNVDMAKLKHEFLAQYYDAHGVPLRARLFAAAAAIGRWGSRLAPVSNWLAGSAPARWLAERFLGISRHRPPPPFARPTFEAWFRRRARRRAEGEAGPGGADRGAVVLFNDTFTNYHYPGVGRAAVRVLEAAGYRVVLAGTVCCGRPMLSNGLVEAARARARRNVEVLAPYAEEGVPIVGCEPSCLLMLREDYLDLLGDHPGARAVASGSLLVEEFLTRAAGDGGGPGPLGVRLRPASRRLIVHGHCHQKALVGMEPTLEMLGWVPGYELVPLDSGCCGMAGSFGYEAEHYGISQAIGERVLFPALRRDPEAGVAVSGVSCRQQVLHASGRAARHPVEWLADALAG